MASRRTFLKLGVAGALGASFAAPYGRPVDAAAASVYKFIYDERFPEAVAVARGLGARTKVGIHAIRGDVTWLWYHDLYHQWGPAKAGHDADQHLLAGITTPESLFCLEMLARDAGLRVAERYEATPGLLSWTIKTRG
jgi:hypothetical protein